MNELIQRVAIAVAGGAVPRPIPGESLDDLRFRCAHAGAVIGVAYGQELEAAHQQAAAAARMTSPDTDTVTSSEHGDMSPDSVTVTSPDDGDGR